MDRDNRWDRVEQAYRSTGTRKRAEQAATGVEAVANSYANGVTDEFVLPTVDYGRMASRPQPIQDAGFCYLLQFPSGSRTERSHVRSV